MEYIEREAAISVIYGQHVGGKEACENARPNTYGADLREIVADIEDIPAADVAPVRHGRWYRFTKVSIDPQSGIGFGRDMWKCDVCNIGEEETKMPYCPNCGAKMDGADKTGAEATE